MLPPAITHDLPRDRYRFVICRIRQRPVRKRCQVLYLAQPRRTLNQRDRSFGRGDNPVELPENPVPLHTQSNVGPTCPQ